MFDTPQFEKASKIYITGSVASGKTTLTKELRETLCMPTYELDLIVHPTPEVRNNSIRQKEIIEEIDKKSKWILEGTNRSSYNFLFEMADIIILLEPPLIFRILRVLTRHIKQNLKLERTSYKPNVSMLVSMYKWLSGYQRNRIKLLSDLTVKYPNKLFIIKSKKDKKRLIHSINEKHYFSANKVLDIYNLLQYFNIKIWIDGGWGIDSLLKKETRLHNDLDIVIEESNLIQAKKILNSIGYKLKMTNDFREWNFVYSNGKNDIDFHVINFDNDGQGIYGPIENKEYYPNYAFGETGFINEQEVNCISLKYQIESHQGYKLRDKDIIDMYNISKNYNIEINKDIIDQYDEIFAV